MNRRKAKELMLKLKIKIEDILDKHLNKIYKIVVQYYNDEITEKRFIKRTINIIYQVLEDVYKNVSEEIKRNYKKLAPFTIQNISDLIYHSDGKSLEERILNYLKQDLNKIELLEKIYNLLLNESKIIESYVIKGKLSKVASILVIECNETDCHLGCSQYAGEYPADENIPLPPYHPNCCCTFYYIETDDEDDINDLDLENEENDIHAI